MRDPQRQYLLNDRVGWNRDGDGNGFDHFVRRYRSRLRERLLNDHLADHPRVRRTAVGERPGGVERQRARLTGRDVARIPRVVLGCGGVGARPAAAEAQRAARTYLHALRLVQAVDHVYPALANRVTPRRARQPLWFAA